MRAMWQDDARSIQLNPANHAGRAYVTTKKPFYREINNIRFIIIAN
jgi:hypothetical protein